MVLFLVWCITEEPAQLHSGFVQAPIGFDVLCYLLICLCNYKFIFVLISCGNDKLECD